MKYNKFQLSHNMARGACKAENYTDIMKKPYPRSEKKNDMQFSSAV